MTWKQYKILKILFWLLSMGTIIPLIIKSIINIPQTDKEMLLYVFIALVALWAVLITCVIIKILRFDFDKNRHYLFMSLLVAYMLLPFYATINIVISAINSKLELDWMMVVVAILDILFVLNLYPVRTKLSRKE